MSKIAPEKGNPLRSIQEIIVSRIEHHAKEMQAKVKVLRWDANVLQTRADAVEREAIELEIELDSIKKEFAANLQPK